jgi:hypothetical protein
MSSQLNQFNLTQPMDGFVEGAVCIPNINLGQRRFRLWSGMIVFTFGFALLGLMMAEGLSPLWRLPLFFVFTGGLLGYFEWRGRTCIFLTALQMRKIGTKFERIKQPEELAQVRRQALHILGQAAVSGALVTLFVVVI